MRLGPVSTSGDRIPLPNSYEAPEVKKQIPSAGVSIVQRSRTLATTLTSVSCLS